jgi:membrane fusion protein (multidrug efflux system)
MNTTRDLLAVLMIVSVSTACNNNAAPPASDAAKKTSMRVKGKILSPVAMDNNVIASGTILSYEEVDLHAETTGRIISINFREGDAVKKGDLLVKINDEDLLAQSQKNAEEIKLSEQQLARQNELLKVQAVSQQDYDIASSQLASLKADKQAVRAALSKTEIRAPFNGIIGLRYISEGSYITPATLIASVQNIQPLKIDFSVPEKYASMVTRGDHVIFTSQSTQEKFAGKVYAIEPKIDLSTRTLKVRAICDNKEGNILPGTFVKVELKLKQTPNALLVPTESVVPVLKGQTVFVFKDGKAKQVAVKTGVRTDASIEITEGLAAGDTLITTGIMFLKTDMPVTISIDSKMTGGLK